MFTRRAVKVLHSFIALFCNLARAAKLAASAYHIRIAHYAQYVTHDITARRLFCFIICFSLILSSQPIFPVSMGKPAEKPKLQLTQGPPGLNLPNLNEARRMNAGSPKIATPASAAFASNIGSSVPATLSMQEGNWPMELINQKNRVGTGREDLLSRNFNWGAPIVSLPGRAGMDLNLGLSLNSLIWTKSGTNIHFNLAKGFPSPGFHLGFPELGAAFYNTETGTGSMLVTMPSGQRYEFRENPSLGSNVYEEMGGTRMLLVIKPGTFNYRDTIWTLLLTDGTAYKFKIPNASSNNPKCIEVKDRNGNFISITYTNFERISAITETTSRVVNFSYDGSNRLISITQNWAGGPHTYATFAYDTVTIQTNFPGLDMVGASNGTTVSVLSRVDMADGKVYTFEYNTYAQVRTIRCFAPNSANPGSFPGDYTLLSSISYDLPADAGAAQSDCPRFFSRIDWAKDWNSGVLTSFDGDGATWGSATAPDGTTYKEFFGASGWQRGLTLQTETWSNGSRKKWTTSTWANDNASVSYWLNPRVVETNVYDGNSQRRTTIDYADFGAVSDIREYGAPPNTSTVLRHTEFEYLRGTPYTGNLYRRLTQLVTSQTVYDGSGALHSKLTYEYDRSEYLVHQGPPIRHDTAKFGPTFVQGRGNLNVIRRWDVTDEYNINKSVASTIGYNTSGSVIFSRDPLNHGTNISYTDSFSDSVNRNTLAYPTTITDADTHSSTIQYHYDFGDVTRTQDPKGAAVVNTYDSIGRPLQATNQVNGGYTRYVYAPNHLSVQSFTTVNDLSSEFYQIMVVDGHGRTRVVASDHPGSAGGYKAQSFEYDIMGRQFRQTNPTEIDVNWVPAGADAAGWVLTSQDYNWQGQPTVTTNQDGTTRSVSYEGCGCSGGDVVTLTDEGTLVNGTLKHRKQKIYHDVFGRVVKSEIYDWNNNVYTTTTRAYNALDQTTTITLQQGSGGPSQVTTFSYDGHGRLSTRQLPNASAPSSFVYNPDDRVEMVTDARGATSAFSYNNRGLVTGITYGAPGGVAVTPNVTFGYDEAGNRTSMTDGLGSATYHYDTLSRMDWETRNLTGVGSFTINYAYNLSGQLTSVTDPSNDTVTYDYNRAGETLAINGSNFGGVTQYASGLQFRASGGLKSLSYGNGLSMAYNYNARLQLQQMEVKGFVSSGSPSLMKIQYQYYPDGTPKFAQNQIDSRFDRAWSYDHVGRLSEAYTGQEADSYAGVSVPSPQTGPYSLIHQYDAWNNLTSRNGRYWTETTDFTTTYNGQNQRQGWTYDAAGNLLTDDGFNQYNYDATGRNVSAGTSTQAFDGLGQVVKRNYYIDHGTHLESRVDYYLYSTPLGGKLLTELWGTPQHGQPVPLGTKIRGYVYAGGVLVAEQGKGGVNYTSSWVEWQHHDGLTGSLAASYNVTTNNGNFAAQQEPDPMGVNVQLNDPAQVPPQPEPGEMEFLGGGGDFFDLRCNLDGLSVGCASAAMLLNSGAAALAPAVTTRYNYTSEKFEHYRCTAQGCGWANSEGKFGKWVVRGERESWRDRTRIAPEDVKDDKGNIIIHKGDELFDILATSGEHLEYEYVDEPESMNPVTREFFVRRGWLQSKTSEHKGSEERKKSCGIKRAPEYNVSGTVTGGTTFRWRATFLNDDLHDPKACEVRQHISWNIPPFGGTTVPHSGFPAGSQPGVWYEDRDQHNNRYGRRTGPYSDLNPSFDWYYGDKYRGSDRPHGFPAGVNFRFRLVVVDVFNGGKTIFTSRTLTVAF
jgi:YD repeat-containing protein